MIEPNDIIKISVTTDLNDTCIDSEMNIIYFEGWDKGKFETYNEIINHMDEDKCILMKATKQSRFSQTVKKGAIVGRGSTVLLLEFKEDDCKDNK